MLQLDFDADVTSYEALLDDFWRTVDPSEPPRSSQYQSAIFTHSPAQLVIARRSAEGAADRRGVPLRTRIEPLDRFYRAEDYHQKYRLRREPALTRELVARFGSDAAMVDSTEAARVNGLLSGHGRRRELLELLPELGLSDGAERVLLARVNG